MNDTSIQPFLKTYCRGLSVWLSTLTFLRVLCSQVWHCWATSTQGREKQRVGTRALCSRFWLMQSCKRSAGTWNSAPLPGWPPFHHPSWSEDISRKELAMKLCTRLLPEWSAEEEDKHFWEPTNMASTFLASQQQGCHSIPFIGKYSSSGILILSVSPVAGALMYVRKLLIVSGMVLGIQKVLNKYLLSRHLGTKAAITEKMH